MRCREARELIPLHAGGDLDADAGPLEAHLSSCPSCAREMASMRGAVDALRGAGETPLRPDPAAFAAGISRRLGAPAAAPRRFSPALRAAAAALAAAAAVVAVFAVLSAIDAPEGGEGTSQARTSGAAVTPGISASPALTGVRNVVFRLPSSSLEPLSGADFELAASVVPDPSAREHLGGEDFMLREFTPVDDTEVSADF